jgi:hypothetical protein
MTFSTVIFRWATRRTKGTERSGSLLFAVSTMPISLSTGIGKTPTQTLLCDNEILCKYYCNDYNLCREVLETLYRLSLTGFLVLINQGSSSQIIVGSVFAFFYVKLFDAHRPYKNTRLNLVKSISLWQIYFIFFISLVSYAELVNKADLTFNAIVLSILFVNIPLELGLSYIIPLFDVADDREGMLAFRKTSDTSNSL